MASPYHQIALECRPLRIDGVVVAVQAPSLGTLRLGLAMLFVGLMLTLSVTLSLTAASNREAAEGRLLLPGPESTPIPTAEVYP